MFTSKSKHILLISDQKSLGYSDEISIRKND